MKHKLLKTLLSGAMGFSLFSISLIGISATENENPEPRVTKELKEAYDVAYTQDQELIKQLNENMDVLLAQGKEAAKLDKEKSGAIQSRAGQLGTYGDILVSLIMDSGSVGFAGHAAIVSTNNAKTVESFQKYFAPGANKKDGVQIYDNTWYKSGAILLRPNNSGGRYKEAAKWAMSQEGKPYNLNFFDKTTTSSFYCSQLVWQAWLAQGVDTEVGSIPNGIIAPADLVNSSNTYVVQKVN